MLIATLEKVLNRGLPRSMRARELCAELAGRSVAIEIRDIARLRLASNGLTLVLARDDSAADATLSGGPLGLLHLLGDGAQAALQRGEVGITGDAEVAQKFSELLGRLRPDLEEELSLLLGDVPAHQLARLARLGGGWAGRAGRTALENLAEYLAHERGDLVPRNEGEQFLRGVDALREGVDRLEARLERLGTQRGPRRREAP